MPKFSSCAVLKLEPDQRRKTNMTHTTPDSLPSIFSPLTKSLLNAFHEGVVVFDPGGRVIYLNSAARALFQEQGLDSGEPKESLLQKLSPLGGRLAPLRAGGLELGEAVFIAYREGPTTLADREKHAIVQALRANKLRLAETAKVLGISRTTLWRRLKSYDIKPDGSPKEEASSIHHS